MKPGLVLIAWLAASAPVQAAPIDVPDGNGAPQAVSAALSSAVCDPDRRARLWDGHRTEDVFLPLAVAQDGSAGCIPTTGNLREHFAFNYLPPNVPYDDDSAWGPVAAAAIVVAACLLLIAGWGVRQQRHTFTTVSTQPSRRRGYPRRRMAVL